MKDIFVIIPVYNGEQYIERCLTSIFNQTIKNIKIICVNDGSTDNSLNVLKSFSNKNLFLINKSNGGVSSARNAGLNFLYNNYSNFYVSFIDCDDFIDLDYFEKLLNMLETNNADIVCASYFYEFSKKSKKYKQIDKDTKFSSFEAIKILLKDETIQSHSHCKLYSEKVLKNARFPEDISWMEDQATIFKTFKEASNGVFISNYSGYHYWQEGESACRSVISNKKVIQSIKGYMIPYFDDFNNYSEQEKSEIKTVACSALANVYLMMYPRFSKSIASKEEKNKFAQIKFKIKANKVIKKYKPSLKKERFKRFIYLYLRPFYSFLYRLFSK